MSATLYVAFTCSNVAAAMSSPENIKVKNIKQNQG
jgi:hypothetical protein